ncbi:MULTISPECIES: response regulator transcription factor [unclassified Sphingobium]|uniref:response regulator transcription factor n=1 Tax=unclassified Sphingobium TaxID=2611147 RepID=UPI0005CC793F|nr:MULTISPECIES: response regulator [unclassified Sphingobium]AJR26986.1 response regulator receiver protein [Sphingobium sp. YBL2]QPI75607.1 response regulator [Sphingobium sp. Cam5-1]
MRPDDAARVYVVDDDLDLGASVARLLRRHGFDATSFLDPAPLLDVHARAPAHCIVTDVMMGDLDGFTFADRVRERDAAVSIIFMTAWPTTANAVDSVRRYGGLDYLEKPLDEERLLAAVHEGAGWARERRRTLARTGALTPRERQIFELLVQGHSNKAIAALLGLSPKTVEDHRASIMAKTGANGLAQLIALAR